jgi:hypothetical protein
MSRATSLEGSEKVSWLAEVVLGWPAVDGESPVRENPTPALCGVPE